VPLPLPRATRPLRSGTRLISGGCATSRGFRDESFNEGCDVGLVPGNRVMQPASLPRKRRELRMGRRVGI
jgi:hypothetical protein